MERVSELGWFGGECSCAELVEVLKWSEQLTQLWYLLRGPLQYTWSGR